MELLISLLSNLSACIFMFVVPLGLGIYMKNHQPAISHANELIMVAIATIVAFAGFFLLIFIGSSLKHNINAARQTIFLQTLSGHLYYCRLFTELIEPIYTGNKLIRIAENADIAEQNNLRVEKTVSYSKTDEFTDILTPLLHCEKLELPYTYIFEDCEQPKIKKEGIFFATFQYHDPETNQDKKTKIHRSVSKQLNLK